MVTWKKWLNVLGLLACSTPCFARDMLCGASSKPLFCVTFHLVNNPPNTVSRFAIYNKTRSSGRSAPLLLAPAEGLGALRAPRALRALLGAFGPLFITMKLYFESEFPFLGGLFYKTFWFEASLYMFLIFWNFRGSFLRSIFGFWKFLNCILNQNSHFRRGLFYKTFWFEASWYMFLIFWKLRGYFLSLIFGFWKFWNRILNQNSHFWGVCFIKLFDLRPPYICFWFFGTLGGLFWVEFLVFENF